MAEITNKNWNKIMLENIFTEFNRNGQNQVLMLHTHTVMLVNFHGGCFFFAHNCNHSFLKSQMFQFLMVVVDSELS